MRANIDIDIDTRRQEPVIFHLTGKRAGRDLIGIDGLRPALLAAYTDLTRLRYDFPLVLTEGITDGAPVQSLTGLVNGLLLKIAPPGMNSEELRKLVLRLEREIRSLVAQGAGGQLSELWDRAAERLQAEAGESLGKAAKISRAALALDGELLDCDAATAQRFLSHAWAAVQQEKARKFHALAGQLTIKLSDILRADFIRSEGGRRVDSLRAAIGPAHHDLFDFEAMSRLLPRSSIHEALPENRRKRIEWALSVLTRQRFFAAPPKQARIERATEPYSFVFDSYTEALAAFRARSSEMAELVKALSIAEIETEGRYDEARHGAFFENFAASVLRPEDLALFPDYLVSVDGRHMEAENIGLMEALSSGVPVKVLVNIHDLLEETSFTNGKLAFGLRGVQLASAAVGLNEVFVLQSCSSNLFQMRDRVLRGLTYAGPALFSVFSGMAGENGDIPPYLSAAAAMQSRAFPAFSYDPSAGGDMASRFSLEDNPQPTLDWTQQDFEYADAALQRVTEKLAFTFADFLATDPRYAKHFSAISRSLWNEHMLPVADWLAAGTSKSPEAVPYLLAVDSNKVLSRIIVDDKAILSARRCLESWRRLQEFGGVHNSHAERLLSREKAAWEQQKQREIESLKAATAPAASVPSAGATIAAAPALAAVQAIETKEPERSSDEAYIETIRCSSCNECTLINDRMFAYNENKQAYIANIDAGSYRELVEAAESCQLGIIHPGKPRNTNEPGLEDLMQRAAAFP